MSEEGMLAGEQSLSKIPYHVAIIMDGNGRWAKARGLPRVAGHRAGTENVRVVLDAARDFGIKVVTLYAFSTENWERPKSEVRALMRLLGRVIDAELDELNATGVRIRHLGRTADLSDSLLKKIRRAQDVTAHNDTLVLNVAVNYGGRAEIVDAVRQIVREGLAEADVDEASLSVRLSTAGVPDPDLVIRTGGDMRLSNFLLWQVAYAEFYATPTFWPDFGRQELYQALLSYQSRKRRFGRLDDERS